MDVPSAITQLRDTIIALDQRLTVVQGNMTDMSQRIDAHEAIHDPMLPEIDTLTNQMAALGPRLGDMVTNMANQDAKVAAVDSRITTVTTEMRDAGLDSGTAARITAMESQVAGMLSLLTKLRVESAGIRQQANESMRVVAELNAMMVNDYPNLISDLQNRAVKIENGMANIVSNMPSSQEWNDLRLRTGELEVQMGPINSDGISWTQRVGDLEDSHKKGLKMIADVKSNGQVRWTTCSDNPSKRWRQSRPCRRSTTRVTKCHSNSSRR